MNEKDEVTRLLRICGHVQGVGFCWHMQAQAGELGVVGWVRNRHDGSVEARLQGPHDAVMRLLAWARQGPPGARVKEVLVEEGGARTDGVSDFRQLPTI